MTLAKLPHRRCLFSGLYLTMGGERGVHDPQSFHRPVWVLLAIFWAIFCPNPCFLETPHISHVQLSLLLTPSFWPNLWLLNFLPV